MKTFSWYGCVECPCCKDGYNGKMCWADLSITPLTEKGFPEYCPFLWDIGEDE